jgi:hypothetical protein
MNGRFPAVSTEVYKESRLGGRPHQTRTSDNNDGYNISGSQSGEDSNPRQHDGVGAEIGLQRLFAKSGQISVKSGVSANS